ncbi:MAG: Clp protease N-terminal domain-containing protein [Actinomycetota bacterium]|nr:Clp protease N-terminal domain-containing protein [Actinomycetota bacterium]
MPKVNVYLPDALASAVKDAGLPVSAVCQAALADAVERVGRTRQAIALLRSGATPAEALARLAEGLQRRMTPRLVTALAVAGSSMDGDAGTRVSTLDLLRGLLDDGENLAVRLLAAQAVDVDALRGYSARSATDEAVATATEAADEPFARMTMPARAAVAAALDAVVELGHNYVGCEHLLIGLVVGDSRAAEALGEQGVRIEALRHALEGAVAGVVHERRSAATRGADADAVGDLVRRVEALERQLAGHASA